MMRLKTGSPAGHKGSFTISVSQEHEGEDLLLGIRRGGGGGSRRLNNLAGTSPFLVQAVSGRRLAGNQRKGGAA